MSRRNKCDLCCTVLLFVGLALLIVSWFVVPYSHDHDHDRLPTHPHNFIDAYGRNRASLKAFLLTNSSWITLASSPPGTAGYLTSIWFAWLETTPTAPNVLNGCFRITFNGADIPQFGGVNGIYAEGLFGPEASTTTPSRTKYHGGWKIQTTTPGQFLYGYIDQWKMPFTNGFRVEYSSVLASLTLVIYSQIDWSLGSVVNPNVNWVMYAAQAPTPTTSVLYPPIYLTTTGATLLSTNAASQLFLLRHWLQSTQVDPSTGQSPAQFLEGKYSIVTDNQTLFITSGTEDMFNSAYYFADGPSFTTENYGYPILPIMTSTLSSTCFNACRVAAYRYFPSEEYAPYASSSMTVQWQNGDPTYPTKNIHSVFWYQSG